MSSKIVNVMDIKRLNLKSILNAVRFEDQYTKKRIAEKTTLSFATVSNMCNLLSDAGLIVESKDEAEAAINIGRAPKNIMLNYADVFVVGVGLQRSGVVKLQLHDLRGTSIRKTQYYYEDLNSIEDFVALFEKEYFRFVKQDEHEKVIGIGAAISGIFDTVTEKIVASEIELFEGQPLKELLSKRMKKSVYIENESNLCAVEIARAHMLEDVIFIYIGEGLGIGAVTKGKLITGRRGYGSEFCHAPLGRLDYKCSLCGSSRCLQTDISTGGFVAKFTKRAPLTGNKTQWEEYLTALKANDAKAQKVAEENGEILGDAISIFVNLLDPSLVVLGGINQDLYKTMLPIIRQICRMRRVVSFAEEPQYLIEEDSDSTMINGAVQMVYASWYPDV